MYPRIEKKVRLCSRVVGNDGKAYSALHEVLGFSRVLVVRPYCIIEINDKACWEALFDSPDEESE